MTLLLAIPNSSLPDKQDGSMCQALTEAIKKRPMSSLTPPATAHVLLQFTQCKDASVCCMANDFAVLMACHFVKARPSCRRKLKPKHLPISDRFNQQAIGMKQN